MAIAPPCLLGCRPWDPAIPPASRLNHGHWVRLFTERLTPPVQGFSAVQAVPGQSGVLWFLSDNGYGGKVNSPDYPLRIYKAEPDFRTAAGGSLNSLIDLTTPVRRRRLQAADAAIRRVVDQVPTLAVTTVMHPSTGLWPRSHFEPTRNLMADEGIESDGVVPTGSAILPHARYVVIDGLDHGDTVDLDCGSACPAITDIQLLKALLAITLKKHAASDTS